MSRGKKYPEPREYHPIHPEKYSGTLPIVARSKWELDVFRAIDRNPNVKSWSSESIIIPYTSPVDKKVHRYFPDIFIEAIGKNGEVICELIEIKPYEQTIPPKIKPRMRETTKRKMTETYAINYAKWEAAKAFCEKKGWKFVLLTEREIYGKAVS